MSSIDGSMAAGAAEARRVREVVWRVWDEMLGCGPLSDDRTFFDAGGTSLLLVEAQKRLRASLGTDVDPMLFFERARLGDFADALAGQMRVPRRDPAHRRSVAAPLPRGAVAIVGEAARLPGSADLDDFWSHLLAGRDLISQFDRDEMEDALSPQERADPSYVAARPVLDGIDMFDARFFGVLPREAALMDPQARLFLEMCVEALDDAGLDPRRPPGAVGVYAGATMSTYMLNNVLTDRAALRRFTSEFQIGNYAAMTGNIPDALATRAAFKLGLTGPAITVATTCSTSLTAIAQAVAALRAGQCDAALAGGISITVPQKRGYRTQEGGMSAADGRCRPFDAQAGGTVFGHGGGVVVLKRLEDALAAGDRIAAVIRGVGLNNDGADKIAFTAPSAEGQAAAIRAAHRDAGIAPETVGYVECHGTATPLGDPIEVRGLRLAFGDGAVRCALGSVKGNIGHLDAGAGVAGVLKTTRVLREGVIPPVAHFTAPNPRIDFGDGRFFVPAGTMAWPGDGPRRAGVSGFGVGGTNVHLVLEAAPVATAEAEPEEPVEGPQILPLSAKSPGALRQMAEDLAQRLEAPNAPALADAAHTLQEGRSVHPHRLAVAATDAAAAARALRATPALRQAAEAPPLIFMFPGQGAQYAGMGAGLYAAEPEYARWIDRGADLLSGELDADLRALLSGTAGEGADALLRETRLTQPALFLTQYACARVWLARGVTPTALIGHSVGEFAAAALAGVMTFETALAIVAARGAAMQAQPPGVMLSVRAPMERLAPHIRSGVDVAARNAPALQVLAGPEDEIAAQEEALEAAGLPCRRLHTSHAFHSAMMEPVTAPIRALAAEAALAPPEIAMISTVTGAPLDAASATDPGYWAGQARAPVVFADALARAAEGATPVLLEVGAGDTLATFAAQTLTRGAAAAILTSLPGPRRDRDDVEAMAAAFGGLWTAGVAVDWSRAGPRGRRKVALPPTRFDRRRHWIDPPTGADASLHDAPEGAPTVSEDTPDMTQTPPDRLPRLTEALTTLLSEISGETLGAAETDVPFLELGFDSLLMGQVAQGIAREFGVTVAFRTLLSEHPSIAALARHLDAQMPPDPAPVAAPAPASAAPRPAAPPPAAPAVPAVPVAQGGSDLAAILTAQMQTMQAVFAQQLQSLGGAPAAVAPAPAPTPAAVPAASASSAVPAVASVPEVSPEPGGPPAAKSFRFGRGPDLSGADLTPEQRGFAEDLARRYAARYSGSKAHTEAHRDVHADPRTVAGFRPEWKELVFPIVAARAHGAHIEDVDGNRLIDVVSGFGQSAFGHAPDFVSRAVAAQIERGYPVGPQTDTAGPVARRFAAMVGHERVTFCNTGSEAVMAAMRLARAVTGRDRIVVFRDDYHGQFDEVLVKGRARGDDRSGLPSAPGVPRAAVQNMVVLPYGTDESLDWIRAQAGDLAAVLVEPVQSRHPELRPAAFCRSLREITAGAGAALIFDEVVTGFRTHPRGMQGVWEIDADMATYGKVVGGGIPVGALAGKARFMDALDGGAWRYGDDSVPETAPTFFAGTFVRHPLTLAAVDATLAHMEAEGDRLWSGAAELAAGVAARMNAALEARGVPPLVQTYSSWLVPNVSRHDPRASLLYPLMRLEGVHILDGFPAYFTTAHGAEEGDRVVAAFETALDALQSVGILAPEAGRPAVERPAAAAAVPLTEAQREIWLGHQMGDRAAASFNEGYTLRLDGPLDVDALGGALDDLRARHDALRLRFARSGESFSVAAPEALPLPVADLSAADDPEAALEAAVLEDAARPFDLVAGGPWRQALLRLGEDRHALLLTAHHIVCDGWSFGTLMEDLAALYRARLDGGAADLAPAPSFAAYAAAAAAVAPRPETRAYWAEVYRDIPTAPDLPTDRPRPEVRSYAGATVAGRIGADRLTAARKAGAKAGCTLFSTLFATLQMTLGRISGASDVVLAVPSAGQQGLDDPRLVGHLVNFLPIRAAFDPEAPAAAHLAAVAEAVMAAFDHGDYTLGTLVRDLDVPRGLSRQPLTEVQFNLERQAAPVALGAATARTDGNAKMATTCDLIFNMVEGEDGLRIEVTYNADLFDAETMARWIDAFGAVLDAVAEDTARPVADLPLMDAAAAEALLASGQGPCLALDPGDTVSAMVAAQAAASPGATAVTDGRTGLSYADLDARIDALAARLQAEMPGEAGARVAVALPRDADLPVALLAVMRAGHTFVPLDPEQPIARLRQVVETAEARALLAHDDFAALAEETGVRRVDPADVTPGAAPRAVGADPARAAYIIFTSGSTGTPKGVEVPQRALVNFLRSMAEAPGLTVGDRLLAVTTVMFDIAILELFLPLTVGATVEVADRAMVRNGFALADRLGRGDITVMQGTPTLWGMLLEAGFAPRTDLRMLAGGEPLPYDLAQTLTAGGAELWNLYGPTETTIWSSLERVRPGAPIRIGAPIANTALCVLDDHGGLCLPGQPGELNIGGAGLANGYYGRPDLTEAAFREVTLAGRPRRLYRTGDLAIRRADGTLDLLGRRDGQIKLRGYRIEIGEIESRLREMDEVAAAAVALRKGPMGDDRLVGYLVLREVGALDPGEAARRLSAVLPSYMVPGGWMTLDALPQTANGKLDRKALPDPREAGAPAETAAADAPSGPTEERIAGIWREVLGLSQVSATASLHTLGADSLTIFRMAARLMDAGLPVEARDLLAHPSVRALAAHVAAAEAAPAAPRRPSLKLYRGGARRAG
ncbi:amino acid adenylation domain-containing protein [Rhodobacteraceae bacterium CCMM004]|nr:amino acid adenylation domain-containing protein [Rhodobacteraceae bacterium CCMM004]